MADIKESHDKIEFAKGQSKISVLGAFTVREGEKAVQMRFGKKVSEHKPGIGLGLPGISEIQTISTRPLSYEMPSLNILTNNGENSFIPIPLEFNTNLIFRITNADSLMKTAPEGGHLETIVNGFLTQKIASDVFNRSGIKEVLGQREVISDSVTNYLQKRIEPWGISIDYVLFKDIKIPHIFTEKAKELYVLDMQKGIEKDKAEIYSTRASTRIEAMDKFYSTIGKLSELCDSKDRWMVLFNFISEDGRETPFSRIFETAMEGRRQGVMARNIAGEIETDPSFPYSVEALRDVYKTVKPRYFLGGEGIGSISDIYEREKKIMAKLYPSKSEK